MKSQPLIGGKSHPADIQSSLPIQKGSASEDSTNHELRIFGGKNIPESSEKQNLNVPCTATIYIAFTLL